MPVEVFQVYEPEGHTLPVRRLAQDHWTANPARVRPMMLPRLPEVVLALAAKVNRPPLEAADTWVGAPVRALGVCKEPQVVTVKGELQMPAPH